MKAVCLAITLAIASPFIATPAMAQTNCARISDDLIRFDAAVAANNDHFERINRVALQAQSEVSNRDFSAIERQRFDALMARTLEELNGLYPMLEAAPARYEQLATPLTESCGYVNQVTHNELQQMRYRAALSGQYATALPELYGAVQYLRTQNAALAQ